MTKKASPFARAISWCRGCHISVRGMWQKRYLSRSASGACGDMPALRNYLDVPDDAADALPLEPASTAAPPSSRIAKQPQTLDSGSRKSTQLWIEVLAVLSLAYFPFLFDAIAGVAGLTSAEPPFVYRTLAFIIRSLAVAMPLLVIVAYPRTRGAPLGSYARGGLSISSRAL